MPISSAAQAAASAVTANSNLIQPLPAGQYSGPGAGIYLEQQNQAELAYQQAMTQLLQQKNTAYHTYGLGAAGEVDPLNQFGRYQGLLSSQERDLSGADEMAQQRGLGGGVGLGMQGESALRYTQGADSLAMQKEIADIGEGYATGAQSALSQRNNAFLQAQLNALASAVASGAFGAAGGGGAGGPNLSDFMYGSTGAAGLSGFSDEALYAAAQAGAPAGAVPMHIMNQGMVQNGMVSIKYKMPDGTTNTIWVPLPSASSSSAPAPSTSTSKTTTTSGRTQRAVTLPRAVR